jgi:hypothetical protein
VGLALFAMNLPEFIVPMIDTSINDFVFEINYHQSALTDSLNKYTSMAREVHCINSTGMAVWSGAGTPHPGPSKVLPTGGMDVKDVLSIRYN